MPLAFIYDVETTGLVKNSLVPLKSQPKVIELFGHLVDRQTGDIKEEIEFFCDPGELIEDVITRITGIKQEQLTGQKPFAFYAPAVARLVSSAEEAVAHNLSFDKALLDAEFERCDIKCEWPRLVCTVESTEWIKGHRLSLSALHEELFGEPFSGAHRARKDVNALTKCYLELVKRGDI